MQELRESIQVSLQDAETQRQRYEAEAEATAQADKAVYQVSSVELHASFKGNPNNIPAFECKEHCRHVMCAPFQSHVVQYQLSAQLLLLDTCRPIWGKNCNICGVLNLQSVVPFHWHSVGTHKLPLVHSCSTVVNWFLAVLAGGGTAG